MKLLSTLLGVVLLLLLVSVNAKTVNTEFDLDSIIRNVDQMQRGFAEKRKENLNAILKSFYQNKHYTANWNEILAKLSITVSSDIFEDLPADASTKLSKGGGRHIKINNWMFFQIIDYSQAAAKYSVAELANISLAETTSQITKQHGLAIDSTFVAWVLAHEVAHHVHADVNTYPNSRADSRSRELKADERAFDILNNAGYSLFLLYRYMAYMYYVDQVKKRAGTLKDESMSMHPSWRTRLEALKRYINTSTPVEKRWSTYSSIGHDPASRSVLHTMYFLSNNLLEHLGFLLVNGSMIPVGVERKSNGEAAVYAMVNGTAYTHTIKNTRSHYTTVEMNGMKEVFAFRDSFAGAASMDQTKQIRDAMALDPLALLSQAIDRLVYDPNINKLAKELVRKRAEKVHDHMLDYYSGKINLHAMQSATQKDSAYYDNRLKNVLGEESFNRLSQVLVQKMTDLIN